jgi:hypothetical protein
LQSRAVGKFYKNDTNRHPPIKNTEISSLC